ncbi:hypothetical protein AVEN_245704-1 [Araneus ventricosus]|uniref:Uncharacterized protein n=1 Tax=Araneus ventricosus TaxID=182803 RepID=A0A4Y2FRB0_ARAVE|nr:hypothetical protein AVEN_245704-1 [Araneus ventricosus]
MTEAGVLVPNYKVTAGPLPKKVHARPVRSLDEVVFLVHLVAFRKRNTGPLSHKCSNILLRDITGEEPRAPHYCTNNQEREPAYLYGDFSYPHICCAPGRRVWMFKEEAYS